MPPFLKQQVRTMALAGLISGNGMAAPSKDKNKDKSWKAPTFLGNFCVGSLSGSTCFVVEDGNVLLGLHISGYHNFPV